MDTPFHGHNSRSRNTAANYGSGSEIRALCVRIATARNKKEDTPAEELYKQMQVQQQQHQRYGGGRNGRYDPDEDAPCYHGMHDDTFSNTPMDDDYTQRRIGIMRQMSS